VESPVFTVSMEAMEHAAVYHVLEVESMSRKQQVTDKFPCVICVQTCLATLFGK
jgi:hypothetical protein